jgi:hypothetical protein
MKIVSILTHLAYVAELGYDVKLFVRACVKGLNMYYSMRVRHKRTIDIQSFCI